MKWDVGGIDFFTTIDKVVIRGQRIHEYGDLNFASSALSLVDTQTWHTFTRKDWFSLANIHIQSPFTWIVSLLFTQLLHCLSC